MSERVGLALGYDKAAPVSQMATAAAAAEARGFEIVFFSETLFSNRDSVSALAAFALAARRVARGATQVVRLRSPLLMAQTAASLDELSGGRLVLALGAYTAMHAAKNGVELTDPLPTLREYVDCIRRLLAGETVTHHGVAVHMDDAALGFQPPRAAVPVWIAANTPQGLAMRRGSATGSCSTRAHRRSTRRMPSPSPARRPPRRAATPGASRSPSSSTPRSRTIRSGPSTPCGGRSRAS